MKKNTLTSTVVPSYNNDKSVYEPHDMLNMPQLFRLSDIAR